MTVSSDFRVSLPSTVPPHADLSFGLDADGLASQPRNFKRHKVLPHPHKDDPQQLMRARYGRLGSERTPLQNAAPSGPRPYNTQRPNRTGRGPEPPPTPPAHSRTSSASHPTDPSSTEQVGNRSRPGSRDDPESRLPVTPPDQQTPPTPNLTPDRTPPGPAAGRVERRPPLSDRNASKLTTDSTAESFRTAREDPYSSDDDDGRSTLRPTLSSAKSSQSTVRQINGAARGKPQPVGLGLGLEHSARGEEAPRTTKEFAKFDGEWAGAEVAANGAGEEWDDQLMRNVTIRKRRPTRPRQAGDQEVLDDRTVTPTNATRALRSMSLQESPIVYPSRRVVSDRLPSRTAPSNSESSVSIDAKRSSIMSTRSTASTVVSAVLVETAPQRRKTLRHVRKQIALRDSGSEISPASSAPTSVSPAIDDKHRRDASTPRLADGTRDSYASTATSNSISSRKARREVWKNGGVPVVIVPDRRSSVKSSKPPSLRSTSSRRSPSVSSVSASQPSRSKEHVPQFERSVRRSRAFSESDGSRAGDERTMDFPPVIPARSSSLSAPTSRNASRTGSLTTDSLRAHNMFQAQQAHHALQLVSRELDKLHGQTEPTTDDGASRRQKEGDGFTKSESERSQPTVLIESALQDEQKEPNGNTPQLGSQYGSPDMNLEQGRLGVDRDGDPFYGKRLSVQNTPFSVASVETTGTSHAEVSEALAVNIYPHQSKSVVLVDHSSKPSESSTLEQYKHAASDIPVLKTTDANGGVPVTPPQQFSFDDVDSPLRNPRAPPLPPAINFIPATPSGLTPATEKQKQLGNYYEMTTEKPKRSMSLLKRALLSRRVSEYGPSPSRPAGLLTRTFSLSRNVRRRPGDWDDERPRLKRYSTADDVPADETRLHPFWRPAYAADDDTDGSSSGEDDYDEDDDGHDERSEPDEDDRTYRYPPIDNRPSSLRPPRRTRSLSERIRRTFAILPQRGSDRYRDRYDSYPATAHDAPDRRTIRRTPSGNLRVMKFRRSMESLTRVAPPEGAGHGSGYFGTHPDYQQQQRRPPTRGYTRLWRSLSLRATQTLSPRRAGSIGSGGFSPAFFSRQPRSSSPVITGPLALGAGRRGSAPGTGTGFEPRIVTEPATGFAHPTGINTNTNPRLRGPTAAATTRPGLARSLSERLNLPRRLSERRREKRTQALRRMISAPREVRDGVGEVIRRESWRRERGPGLGREWDHQHGQGQGQDQQGQSQQRQQQQGKGQQQQQQQQQYHQQQPGVTGTDTGIDIGAGAGVNGGADAGEDADARYMREQQAERRRRRRQMWQERREQEMQQQGQGQAQQRGQQQVQGQGQTQRELRQWEGQEQQAQGQQQWERQGRRAQG